MRIIYALLFLSFFSLSSNAQIADGSVAPDFVVTDIDGNEVNLYSILDEGKTVIMDIFATWCGPCWSYHEAHILADAYDLYGPNGTDELMVLAVEGDGSTALECIYGPTDCNSSTYGDWTAGVPYPIINNAGISADYNLAYYPTIFIIYPNKIVSELGQQQLPVIRDWLDNKPGLEEGLNVGLINFDGTNNALCNDLWPEAPYYLVSNTGDVTINSADISITKNGEELYSEAWTGTAVPYGIITEIQLATQIITENTVFELRLDNINGDADQFLSIPTAITLENTNVINVTAEADANQGSDNTRYEIQTESGVVVASQTLETGAGVQTYSHTLDATGCHSLWVYDGGGNGVETEFTVRDSEGALIYEASSLGSLSVTDFNVNSISNADEILTDINFMLTPNPADDLLSINMDITKAMDVKLSIVNIAGQIVYQDQLYNLVEGTSSQKIDISSLEAGLYLLNLSNENGVLTQKFAKK